MTVVLILAGAFLLVALLVLGMCRAGAREDEFIGERYERMADPENRREVA